jgi:hypothetical protein
MIGDDPHDRESRLRNISEVRIVLVKATHEVSEVLDSPFLDNAEFGEVQVGTWDEGLQPLAVPICCDVCRPRVSGLLNQGYVRDNGTDFAPRKVVRCPG